MQVKKEIRLPKLGLTMEEAQLASWDRQIGDYLQPTDRIATVETDKSVLDVEAGVQGYLVEQVAKPGDMVAVSDIIAYVADQTPQPESTSSRESSGRLRVSPAARKLATDKRVDLAGIIGTGPQGRIVLRDIIGCEGAAAANRIITVPASRERPEEVPTAASSGINTNSASSDVLTAAASNGLHTETETSVRKPVSRMRRIIADRLTHSFRDIPQFQVNRSADMTNVLRIRQTLLNSIELSAGIKLSVLDFVIQAAAQALRRVPQVNVSYYEESGDPYIMEHSRINIGLAVALQDGLVVPVIRDADCLSLLEIAKQRDGLATAAKTGRLKPEQSTGGTFTISSLAAYDAEGFTALVNPPESGILAVGKAKPTPIVKGESIQAVSLLNLTGSFDHRPLDGATGARFMQELVQQLESDKWKIV